MYVNGVSTNDIITARAADSNGASVINILAEGTTGISRIKFSDTAAATGDGWISYYHSDRAIAFATAGTGNERLRIESNGWQKGHTAYQSVGINTFASWARTGGAIRGEVGYNAVTLDYMYFGTGTTHPLALRTNNITALVVDTGQRVLLGHIASQEVYGTNK